MQNRKMPSLEFLQVKTDLEKDKADKEREVNSQKDDSAK